MPGIGKSGNCRSAALRLIFVRASSEALVVEVEGWDSSLVALSVVSKVLECSATGGCCVVIVKREEKRKRREEVSEVRLVVRYANDKNFRDGKRGGGSQVGHLDWLPVWIGAEKGSMGWAHNGFGGPQGRGWRGRKSKVAVLLDAMYTGGVNTRDKPSHRL